jgi:hypothetical protein
MSLSNDYVVDEPQVALGTLADAGLDGDPLAAA